MTPAEVIDYHRRQAKACRESEAIARAGFNAGCDDAALFADGYRKQAEEHDRMAMAIEQLLPPNSK